MGESSREPPRLLFIYFFISDGVGHLDLDRVAPEVVLVSIVSRGVASRKIHHVRLFEFCAVVEMVFVGRDALDLLLFQKVAQAQFAKDQINGVGGLFVGLHEVPNGALFRYPFAELF